MQFFSTLLGRTTAHLLVIVFCLSAIDRGLANDVGERHNCARPTSTLSVGSASTTDNPNSPNAIITILSTTGTSGNSRAPQGSQRYIRTAYLITAAEMAAAGFPSSDINLIGFNYATAQSVTTTGTFMVYLQNTSDVTYSKPSTTWSNGTNGVIDNMTLVHNNSITIPAVAGNFDIPFVGGSTFSYTGGGLYVAFDYQNAAGTLSTSNVANCNTNLVSGLRNAFSTTTLPTALTNTSDFRPVTRLGNNLVDIVSVPVIYTLGKIPIPAGNPDVIGVPVTNVSVATPASFDLTLTVKNALSGTVRYTNTQNVPSLAAGATQIVSFTGWSPTIAEDDSIIAVTSVIAGEDIVSNNRRATIQNVNTNTFSYAQGTTPSGGVGFTGATGDFVAKFTPNTSVNIDQVQVNFSAGGQPYNIGIWDASGAGGTPGTNVYTSGALTSAVGVSTVPISPAVNVTGSFFVGVKQTGTTNISFSYQTENPIRAATFYYTTPTGGTSWTDFAPANLFRFMIEPRITGGTDVRQTSDLLPRDFALSQNYPNPFNPTTTFRFDLPNAARVTLKVHDMLGQEVATLFDGQQTAGSFEVVWDGRNSIGAPVASGMYFYKIIANSASGATFTSIKKMVLVK